MIFLIIIWFMLICSLLITIFESYSTDTVVVAVDFVLCIHNVTWFHLLDKLNNCRFASELRTK